METAAHPWHGVLVGGPVLLPGYDHPGNAATRLWRADRGHGCDNQPMASQGINGGGSTSVGLLEATIW